LSSRQAALMLEDGTLFRGMAYGAVGETCGEIVFNTGMTGYQEVLTDPSYCGQIVTMAAPHIGNVGLNDEDHEASRPWLAGFVLRRASLMTSNWRATMSLDSYLKAQGVVAMSDCPTRALVRHVRSQGAMRAVLSSVDLDPSSLLRKAQATPSMSGADLASTVTCRTPYSWSERANGIWYPRQTPMAPDRPTYRVVAYDYGMKFNILRLLAASGFEVRVVPASTPASAVLDMQPAGIFLSNGPGDPAAVAYAIDNVRRLLGKLPIFGICLGHQILGLALGGRTYKLKFGHRGINQPVKNLLTGQVEITTHNHGFAVDAESLPTGVDITHMNLNDGCVEGLRQMDMGAFSVQYHPEAGAGPHDALYLFDQFRSLIAERPIGLAVAQGGERA
jgi:carbamoyl-phosphate synthase small subunit